MEETLFKKKCNKCGCNGACSKCNNCNNFHKVLDVVKVTDTSVLFRVTNNENVSINNNFCFVFPCGINPSDSVSVCYFDVNGELLKLKGALSSDLKRRKLYKASITEDKFIQLSPLVKF